MTTDNWINLVVAVGTIMLAVTAFWTIIVTSKENRTLRKEASTMRKRIIASEKISEWVEKCLKSMGPPLSDTEESTLNFLEDSRNLDLDVEPMKFAGRLFDDTFQEKVNDACSKYDSFYQSINELYLAYYHKKGFDNISALKESARKNALLLMPALWELCKYSSGMTLKLS